MFIQRVVNALESHQVSYAIVGGYAVALHGAIRGTVDIDIVIALKLQAFESAESALLEMGLESRLPVTANDVFMFREEYIVNKNLIAWSFANPNNPLEIVDIIITEDLGNINTVTKKAYNLKLRVASIPDLIAMKKKSGRPQDLEDIRALEKLS